MLLNNGDHFRSIVKISIKLITSIKSGGKYFWKSSKKGKKVQWSLRELQRLNRKINKKTIKLTKPIYQLLVSMEFKTIVLDRLLGSKDFQNGKLT